MKKRFCLSSCIVGLLFSCSLLAAPGHLSLNQTLQKKINSDRVTYQLTALAVSISLPGDHTTRDFISGTIKKNHRKPINTGSLFQVGSITKSFTSVIIQKLAANNKLKLSDPIGKYLPQYPQWENVTIRQLLSMTSRIPSYTDSVSFFNDLTTNPVKQFTKKELVAYAYAIKNPTTPWYYSNTNYILLGMIIDKVTTHSVAYAMKHLLLGSRHINLLNTFFLPKKYPRNIMNRMVHGYAYNPQGPFYGQDITNYNMSWASSAGALVSNTRDLVRWCRALFNDQALSAAQIKQMMRLVSEANGQPIAKLSATDPYGYGLGLEALYVPQYGTIWYHGGATFGYRAIFLWLPKEKIALAITADDLKNPDYLMKIVQHVITILVDKPIRLSNLQVRNP